MFINYYSAKSDKECISDLGYSYSFSSGRKLRFIRTPYAHSSGSFVTYDEKTKVVFSGDLFGGYDTDWNLYSLLFDKCTDCEPQRICPENEKHCQMVGMTDFHKRIMTSTKALKYALKQIEGLEVSLIAPQHGSIFNTPFSCEVAKKHLDKLTGVGIDGVLEEEGA